MECKLTAILSADVKGYSRLMGEDAEATIRTLTAYREIISTLIQQHRGRVVDSPGDNLLAEFASAVDAVQSAVVIQRELKARNTDLSDSRKMEFRIGINVGDVIVEGEQLYGDDVNIAARMESLAEPGGMCISGKVFEEIESKLPLHYEYMGEQTVKNIAKLVRVYRVALGVSSPPVTEDHLQSRTRQRAATFPLPHGRGSDSHSVLQGNREPKRSELRRIGNARRNWALVTMTGLGFIAATLVAVRYWPSPIPNP
jgi:adenylate cyclase